MAASEARAQIYLTPFSLPNGTVGVPYGPHTLTVVNGLSPYDDPVTAGTLPPGLTVTPEVGGASVSVSGTPTQAGSFRFTVTATDSRGGAGGVQYHVTIAPAPVTIAVAPLSLPNGVVGYGLRANHHGGRRHRPLHVCGDVGRAPGRAHTDHDGRVERHADQRWPVDLHDHGNRSTNADRHAYLYRHYRAASVPSASLRRRSERDGGRARYTQLLTATGGESSVTGSVTGTLPGLTVDPEIGRAPARECRAHDAGRHLRFDCDRHDSRGAAGSVHTTSPSAPAP